MYINNLLPWHHSWKTLQAMKANFLVFHLDVPAGMMSNVHKTEVTQDACKFFAPNFHYQYAKVNIAYLAISKVLDKGWTITPTQKKDKLSSCSETNTSSQMGKDANQWQDLISGNMQLPWNVKRLSPMGFFYWQNPWSTFLSKPKPCFIRETSTRSLPHPTVGICYVIS